MPAALEPNQQKPMELRISCSSLAFSDMTWEAALEAIKKLGFRWADLAMFEGWTHVSPSALTNPRKHGRSIAETCKRIGIEPVAIHTNFAVGDRRKFPGITTPSREHQRTILGHFDRVLTCARVAGVPLINVQPGKFIEGMPREQCLQNAIGMLKQMQARAAKQKVALSFENHTGSLGEQPQDALALLEAVPGLQVDYDFSHIVANSIPIDKTKPLLKHVGHVGIRNAKPGNFNVPVREGKLDYDLAAFLKVLRQAKVKADVSIEYYEPAKRDSITKLRDILVKAGLPLSP